LSLSSPNNLRTYVEISRGQLAANFAAVRSALGPKIDVMGVVKADAYGHGMLEVSHILVDHGARWLAVSNVAEGAQLRAAGFAVDILVMAGLLPEDYSTAINLGLTPVAHSIEDIHRFDEAAFAANRRSPFHLKFDTGMGRLGTRETPAEVAEVLRSLRMSYCDGLLTHFASASDFSTPQTDDQIARFDQTIQEMADLGVAPRYLHLASTNAIGYARPNAWRTIVRPGHAIYGYISPAKGVAPPNALDVQPALTWKVKIVAVKDVPANSLVGYGGIACVKRATRLAILGAGYADGIPHRLSNRGKVIAGGKFAPILGAVSMDLTTIDITDSPHMKAGEDITLLGREGKLSINAQEMARWAGTISYSVLCGIKPRVERVYLD
jgi:alanine racemase